MDFTLTDEQKQIKTMVRDFCKREIDPKRIDEMEDRLYNAKTVEEARSSMPRDILKKLNEVGLRQLVIPKKYGGGSPESGVTSNITLFEAIEELGYWGRGAGILLGALYSICKIVVANPFTTEEEKERFCTMFMNDPTIWLAGAVTEPSGGTDLHMPYDEPGAALKDIFAYKDGKEWIINGQKMFCSGGAAADVIPVLVRTNKGGPLTESSTVFMIYPANTKGLTMILNRFMGPDLGGNVQMHFDNVRVPEEAVIGPVNKGWEAFVAIAMMYKWLMTTQFLGEMRRIYDDLVEYAKRRVQGGKPIIQHSSVGVMLGEIAAKMEAFRAFTYRTAWEQDQWEKEGRVKYNHYWNWGYLYLLKTIGFRLIEIAMDIYGSIGKALDMPVERFTRRIITWEGAGDSTSMNALKCSMSHNHYDPWKPLS